MCHKEGDVLFKSGGFVAYIGLRGTSAALKTFELISHIRRA